MDTPIVRSCLTCKNFPTHAEDMCQYSRPSVNTCNSKLGFPMWNSDENGMNNHDFLPTGAKKFDSGKPRTDLLMDGVPSALLGIAEVLTYGFQKYGGAHGWKALPDAIKRYEAAMVRHQLLKAQGEIIDQESGKPHSWHIACNALFIAELESKRGIEKSNADRG